uniref:Uncharacterized protein n=1 Tax=Meloidogyne enterolobii TaxID=390850 RepID=A0A6V7VUX1_MELEN|nr:unnamed protein product [Meloidogyne enterolobii]
MPPQMPPQQPMIPYTGHDINNPGYTPQPARDDYAGSHEPGPKGYCAISGKPLYDTPPQPADYYGGESQRPSYFDYNTQQWIPYNPAPQHHEENGNNCSIM